MTYKASLDLDPGVLEVENIDSAIVYRRLGPKRGYAYSEYLTIPKAKAFLEMLLAAIS